MKIKEGQLVCVSYLVNVNTGDIISTNTDYNYDESKHKYNMDYRRLVAWLRVKFVDSDGVFVGEVERVERNTWSELDIKILVKGEHTMIDVDRVSAIADPDRQFCYSDNVSQCDCPGLCRNK